MIALFAGCSDSEELFQLYLEPPVHGAVTGGTLCFISLKNGDRICDEITGSIDPDLSLNHPYSVTFETSLFRGYLPWISIQEGDQLYLPINKINTIQTVGYAPKESPLIGKEWLFDHGVIHSFREDHHQKYPIATRILTRSPYPLDQPPLFQIDHRRLLFHDEMIKLTPEPERIPLTAPLPAGNRYYGVLEDQVFILSDLIPDRIFRLLPGGQIEQLIPGEIPGITPQSFWITLNNRLYFYNGSLHRYHENRFKELQNYPGGPPVASGGYLYTIQNNQLYRYNTSDETAIALEYNGTNSTLYPLDQNNTLIIDQDRCLKGAQSVYLLSGNTIRLITTTPDTLLCNIDHIDLGHGHYLLFNPEPFQFRGITIDNSRFHLLTLPE